MDSHAGTLDRDSQEQRQLSTGHIVSLPLELSCTLGGVVVPARRTILEGILPDRLSPLSIAPRVGCVALVGIQYHWVGHGDEFKPYNEFAVIVPAVWASRTDRPLARLLGGEPGGYVHWLPVTSDASVALGRELWGYPKERTQITVTDGPRGLRTVVDGPDEKGDAIRLEVSRPRCDVSVQDVESSSFTARDGGLIRARMQLRGEVSVGPPLGTRLEVAPELASELGLRQRPLARLYGARVRARLSRGEPVSSR
ncbi:acetoacetate decarboxylase family protein [Natronococcus sp. A-GB1]|uniref:acetoacetate decarboxylase family protein n=1 Tax=Natronococcus sp. A-GB1 TaxID=3037648 RepID=UPI00241DBA62|nr:acetoacetate decarboxylase family protein [Natronococcus sp. A-GB1]MDG5761474.1 acetoacetate decarboxylase family protein [Natronococcus sp. A-GB1]